MDEEKKAWLKSIGAGEFSEPVKYIYTFPGYKGAFRALSGGNAAGRIESPVPEEQSLCGRNY